MSDKTDILIVGAGVVGSVASLLLADAGFSVRVLESKKLSYKSNLKKTAWVSSLNLTSEQVLRSVGAVFADFSDFATPVVELDVVDMHAGSIKFSASAIAKSHLSTIVDNSVLLQVLWSKMREHDNIAINDECQVDDIANNSDEVAVNGVIFLLTFCWRPMVRALRCAICWVCSTHVGLMGTRHWLLRSKQIYRIRILGVSGFILLARWHFCRLIMRIRMQ